MLLVVQCLFLLAAVAGFLRPAARIAPARLFIVLVVATLPWGLYHYIGRPDLPSFAYAARVRHALATPAEDLDPGETLLKYYEEARRDETAQAWRKLGKAQMLAGRYRPAAESFLFSYERGDDDPQDLVDMCVALLQEATPRSRRLAMLSAEEGIALFPQFYRLHDVAGFAAYSLGEKTEALTHWRRALQAATESFGEGSAPAARMQSRIDNILEEMHANGQVFSPEE